MKEMYQFSIDADVEKGFVKILNKSIGSQRHFWKGMVFATSSSTKLQQTGYCSSRLQSCSQVQRWMPKSQAISRT